MEGMTDLILQSVRGENLFKRPRWPEPLQNSPEYAQLVDDVLTPEREFIARSNDGWSSASAERIAARPRRANR